MLESKVSRICVAILAWVTYHNSAGKIKETAIKDNSTGIVKYYNREGKFIKEEITNKHITTIYNSKGKIIGSILNQK